MTLRRGISLCLILCSMIVALFLIVILAQTAHAQDRAGTVDTLIPSNSGSVGSLTSPAPETTAPAAGTPELPEKKQQEPSNDGDSSNASCDISKKPNYTYDLQCGVKKTDPKTLKVSIGQRGCPCVTKKLSNGDTIKGVCVFNTDQKKGVCFAKDYAEAPGGSGSDGGGGASTPSPKPQTPSVPSVGDPPKPIPVGDVPGSGSGVITNPDLGDPNTPAPAPSPTPGGVGGGGQSAPSAPSAPPPASSIGSIGNNTGGSGYGQPLPTGYYGSAPIQTGSTWANLAAFRNSLSASYLVPPATYDARAYYQQTTYQVSPPGYYSVTPQVTFVDSSKPYSPTTSATTPGFDNFMNIIFGAGYSATKTISDVYQSLSNLGNNSITDLPTANQIDGSSHPFFDTSITSTNEVDETIATNTETEVLSTLSGESPDTPPVQGTQLPQNSAQSLSKQASANLQAAQSAAQKVQNSLKELRTTVEKIKQRSASTTATTTPSIAQSEKTMQADKASSALETAQQRMTKLQSELELEKQKLGETNARVQELTTELNALNQRIKAVNQGLSDPNLTDSDFVALVTALIENIQLTLADVERRLQEATAASRPKTVGEVVVTGFSGALSGFVDWTAIISKGFSDFIQSIWRSLFPAY